VTIEIDRDLAEYIRSLALPNVTVVTGDALKIDWTITLKDEYKIVANIPYSITSPLLRKIFHLEKRPASVVLLVQKEVAERITAKPGDRNRGFLTIIVEANGQAEIVRTVKPGSFYPQPKVESAVVRVTLKRKSSETELFWPVVEAAFSQPRQTAVNSIANRLNLTKAEVGRVFKEQGLDLLSRPAALTLKEWEKLSRAIQKELIKG
jgi:16S rRNA (adenine1518-N6/adenine1519-N6)-dimethyltransferase